MHILTQVLAATAAFAFACSAAAYTFTTAAECRDFVHREREAWSAAYSKHTTCWMANKCGNPGADPQLKEWMERNAKLGDQCSEMQYAKRLGNSENPRTTTVPYQGPDMTPRVRQVTRPVDTQATNRSSSRNVKIAQGSALLGGVLSALLSKQSEAEPEDEEDEESEVQPEIRRPIQVAKVEPQPQASKFADAHEKIQAHNERAKGIFDAARDALKWPTGIQKIQDFAWDQLQSKIDDAMGQLIKMEGDINAMLASIPTKETVTNNPNAILLPKSLRTESADNVDYRGQVGANRAIQGPGLAETLGPDGTKLEAWGNFSDNGRSHDGTVKYTYRNGATDEWIGQFKGFTPTGPSRLVANSSPGRWTKVILGAPQQGRSQWMLITSSHGTSYSGAAVWGAHGVGNVDAQPAIPQGFGRYVDAREEMRGFFVDGKLEGIGERTNKLAPGYFVRCVMQQGQCTGPAILYLDDGRFAGTMAHGEWVGIVVWSSNLETYTGEVRGLKFHGQGTMTRRNGEIHVGHFVSGARTGLGRTTLANGTRLEGRWDKGELVDGVIISDSGRRTIGAGTIFDIDNVARQVAALSTR